MNDELRFYEVGGCVRDAFLGLPVKDVDFAVEAPSFEVMEAELERMGFKIFQSRPEFLTIRASVPKGHSLRERTKDADFVMCRADGPSSDGRRPDFVIPGTIQDDLARRDFTVNAMARDEDGSLVDPFDGHTDLTNGHLRFVGEAQTRISEDGLRVLRGFRFMITKGFSAVGSTWEALLSEESAEMLMCVSIERVREELVKMFDADTWEAMGLLTSLPDHTFEAIFRDGLRMTPTLKGRNS